MFNMMISFHNFLHNSYDFDDKKFDNFFLKILQTAIENSEEKTIFLLEMTFGESQKSHPILKLQGSLTSYNYDNSKLCPLFRLVRLVFLPYSSHQILKSSGSQVLFQTCSPDN